MRILLPALAALLLLAGCGDDSGASEETKAADGAAADRAALALEDFPAGWQLDEADDAPDRTCPAFASAEGSHSGRSPYMYFDRGDAATEIALNRVYLFTDVAKAEAVFAEFDTPDTAKCFGEQFREGIDEEAEGEVGDVETATIEVGAAGEAQTATRLTVPLPAEGEMIDLIAEFVVVRKGRALSVLGFVNAVEPLAEDVRDTLIKTSVDKLPA